MPQQNNRIGLYQDEEILWQGEQIKRDSAKEMTLPILVFLGIILILCIFLVFLGYIKLALFGCVPIIAAGAIYFAVRKFLKYRREQTVFILTNMRAVRCDGVFRKSLRDARFRQIKDILLRFDKGNKTGTILFSLRDGEHTVTGSSEIEFNDIKEVISVYNLAQKQLQNYREKNI